MAEVIPHRTSMVLTAASKLLAREDVAARNTMEEFEKEYFAGRRISEPGQQSFKPAFNDLGNTTEAPTTLVRTTTLPPATNPTSPRHYAHPSPQPNSPPYRTRPEEEYASPKAGYTTMQGYTTVQKYEHQEEKYLYEANSRKGSLKSEQLEQAVLAASLRNENELLRLQLNDISTKERMQRNELAALKENREQQVAALVREGTGGHLAEIQRLSQLLSSTSQELQQVTQHRNQLEQALEEQSAQFGNADSASSSRLRATSAVLQTGAATVARLADSVQSFQHHVLPTFKLPPGTRLGPQENSGVVEGDEAGLCSQLARLERNLQLLRMVVDAKNDTLVLIRGRLKQENEQLRQELEEVSGQKSDTDMAILHKEDSFRQEKDLLRQELHSLQELYDAELRQVRATVATSEANEQKEAEHAKALEKELLNVKQRLKALEEANQQLQEALKEEAATRQQVVGQLAAARKAEQAIRDELETLKLSQKFLVRAPKGGLKIPAEKMDLMNMVNQLLGEVNKVKAEKIALEEEVKTQRRAQLREKVQCSLTQRDVNMAASDKVRDTEITHKLMRQRLEELTSDATPPLSTRSEPPHLRSHYANPPTTTLASPMSPPQVPERDMGGPKPLRARVINQVNSAPISSNDHLTAALSSYLKAEELKAGYSGRESMSGGQWEVPSYAS